MCKIILSICLDKGIKMERGFINEGARPHSFWNLRNLKRLSTVWCQSLTIVELWMRLILAWTSCTTVRKDLYRVIKKRHLLLASG